MQHIGSHQLLPPAPGTKLHHIDSSMMFVNTYVLADLATNECVVIDPGFQNPALFDLLENSGYKVELIIATHAHGDHTALIGPVQQQYGGRVAVHGADSSSFTGVPGRMMGMEFTIPKPDLLLGDGDVIEVGEAVRLRVIHTPGHSPGGICLLSPPYLFTGDTLFWNTVGRTDFAGGDIEQLKHSVAVTLAALDDSLQVLPGHEGFTTLANEKANNIWFTKE